MEQEYGLAANPAHTPHERRAHPVRLGIAGQPPFGLPPRGRIIRETDSHDPGDRFASTWRHSHEPGTHKMAVILAIESHDPGTVTIAWIHVTMPWPPDPPWAGGRCAGQTRPARRVWTPRHTTRPQTAQYLPTVSRPPSRRPSIRMYRQRTRAGDFRLGGSAACGFDGVGAGSLGDGFEGPLNWLLEMAQVRKIDLATPVDRCPCRGVRNRPGSSTGSSGSRPRSGTGKLGRLAGHGGSSIPLFLARSDAWALADRRDDIVEERHPGPSPV